CRIILLLFSDTWYCQNKASDNILCQVDDLRPVMATARARNYAGLSAEERREARRERLIEGAIRAYGELGYRNTTVKAVCEAAGLTERYFYESFANSEALLVAAFDTVSRRVFTCLERVRKEHSGATAEARGHAV